MRILQSVQDVVECVYFSLISLLGGQAANHCLYFVLDLYNTSYFCSSIDRSINFSPLFSADGNLKLLPEYLVILPSTWNYIKEN